MAIDAIWAVFELRSIATKTDYCRLFVREGFVTALSAVLSRVVIDPTLPSKQYTENVVDLVSIFSNADSDVRAAFAHADSLSCGLREDEDQQLEI